MTQAKQDTLFNGTVLSCFSVIALIGVLNHEIWLDEAHHWLFARDSNSISELWSNMRYDGHPILWNVLLFFISRFSKDVMAMQLLNVAFAVGAIGVFLFNSPFSKPEKLLFVFGYFFLYEYTVISRNYGLLLLFLFVAIVFYTKRKHLLLGISLAALANTHLFGLLFALLISGLVMFDWIAEKKFIFQKPLVIGALIFTIGVLISLYQVFPPGDSVFYAKAQQGSVIERLGRTTTVFLKGFVPLPDFSNEQFWNTNALMEISKPICVVLSMILFASPLFFFRKRLSLVLFFYLGSLVLIMFFFLSGLNAVRYYGFCYLLLICCFWLERSGTPYETPNVLKGWSISPNIARYFFVTMLIIHVLAAIPSFIFDLNRPFSNSKNAAQVILRDTTIHDYLSAGCGAAPVSSYLEEKVFYLNIQAYSSFCLSGKPGSADEVESRILGDASAFVSRTKSPAFLITHFRLSDRAPTQFVLEGAFEHSVTRNENYFIYKVNPN
jgi:hypothetical protein